MGADPPRQAGPDANSVKICAQKDPFGARVDALAAIARPGARSSRPECSWSRSSAPYHPLRRRFGRSDEVPFRSDLVESSKAEGPEAEDMFHPTEGPSTRCFLCLYPQALHPSLHARSGGLVGVRRPCFPAVPRECTHEPLCLPASRSCLPMGSPRRQASDRVSLRCS